MRLKREIRKVKKMLRKGYIPVLDDKKILFVIKNGVAYEPKYELEVL